MYENSLIMMAKALTTEDSQKRHDIRTNEGNRTASHSVEQWSGAPRSHPPAGQHSVLICCDFCASSEAQEAALPMGAMVARWVRS